MSDQINSNILRAVDSNGDPVPAARMYFYDVGTANAKTVYSDEALAVPHGVPLTADGSGVFAPVFTDAATVKVNMIDTVGASLPGYPVEEAFIVRGGGSSAGNVIVTPITGLPQTNVQAALEGMIGTPAGRAMRDAEDTEAQRDLLDVYAKNEGDGWSTIEIKDMTGLNTYDFAIPAWCEAVRFVTTDFVSPYEAFFDPAQLYFHASSDGTTFRTANSKDVLDTTTGVRSTSAGNLGGYFGGKMDPTDSFVLTTGELDVIVNGFGASEVTSCKSLIGPDFWGTDLLVRSFEDVAASTTHLRVFAGSTAPYLNLSGIFRILGYRST